MTAQSLRIARGFTLPLDLATEAIGVIATRGAGKSYTSTVLIEEMYARGIQVCVVDPMGVYWGLRAGADGEPKGGLPVIVLGGPHGDAPLEPTAGALIADLLVDTGQSLVLDLSEWSKQQQTRFVTDFAERLFQRKAGSQAVLHLVIDEADEFAPERTMRDEARMLAAVARLVKRGRQRGIGVTLISQRTQAISKSVLDLIETLVAMRTLSVRGRDAIKGWIAAKDERDELGVIESLPGLPTGTAWVWSPVRQVLTKIQVRRIHTFDSYATPRPGQVRVEPRALTPVDLAKLGKQIAATVERAKENDPVALRRRIRELEQQVGRERVVEKPVVETVIERVEVPVVTEAQLKRIEKVTERIEKSHSQTRDVYELMREVLFPLASNVRDALNARSFPRVPEPRRTTPLVPPPSPVAALSREPRETPPVDSNGGLTNPEQRVLDSIAWFGILGETAPSKQQVGFVAGYRVGRTIGGAFGNLLGRLRSSGYIEYPGPGSVALTDAGARCARVPRVDPSDEAVHEAVRARLTNPERKVLDLLIERWPDPYDKLELAAAAGYQVERIGGAFGNILGKLHNTLGVIDYLPGGHARASDVLFPVAAR